MLKAEVQIAPTSDPTDTRPLSKGDLLLSLSGNWSIHIDEMAADAELPTSGKVTVTWGASTLQGYVERAAVDRGNWSGVIVGGAGGLDKPVPAQHFFQTPAINILRATLAAVGETLASDSTGLSIILDYPRRAMVASRCLDEICDALGIMWRVKLDGSVWLGTHPWPTSTATFTYQQLDASMLSPLCMPDANQPLLEPGTTVVLSTGASASALEKAAQRITAASYAIQPGDHRVRLWLADLNATVLDDHLAADRLHAGFAAIAIEAVRSVDWYRNFQGTVITQRSDGTLDVKLDDVRGVGEIPPIRGVKVSVPVGGAVRTVRANERCTVLFEAGDFQRPRSVAFESLFGAAGATALGIARETDRVDCGTLVLTVAAGPVLTGSYTDPFGVVTPVAGNTITALLKGKIVTSSADLKLPP